MTLVHTESTQQFTSWLDHISFASIWLFMGLSARNWTVIKLFRMVLKFYFSFSQIRMAFSFFYFSTSVKDELNSSENVTYSLSPKSKPIQSRRETNDQLLACFLACSPPILILSKFPSYLSLCLRQGLTKLPRLSSTPGFHGNPLLQSSKQPQAQARVTVPSYYHALYTFVQFFIHSILKNTLKTATFFYYICFYYTLNG